MITFSDLMTVEIWDSISDPIGLLSYQNHKRRKINMVESILSKLSLDQYKTTVDLMSNYDWIFLTIDSQNNVILKRSDSRQNVSYLTVSIEGETKRIFDEDLNKIPVNEVLTIQQRMRRKILMKRLAPRLARARKLAMHRRAGNDILKRRSLNLARRTMTKKLLGGRDKANVSNSERGRVEKILATRKQSIERLATRLLPQVKKQQALRFAAKQNTPAAKAE